VLCLLYDLDCVVLFLSYFLCIVLFSFVLWCFALFCFVFVSCCFVLFLFCFVLCLYIHTYIYIYCFILLYRLILSSLFLIFLYAFDLFVSCRVVYDFVLPFLVLSLTCLFCCLCLLPFVFRERGIARPELGSGKWLQPVGGDQMHTLERRHHVREVVDS
jgi:hypothetical protein